MKMKKLSILIAILIFLSLSFANSTPQSAHDLFQKALAKERAEGNLKEAIALYEKVIQVAKDESLAAQAQLRIGICYETLGMREAEKAYQKVIDNYPKQSEAVEVAKEKLSILLKAQSLVEKGDKEFKIRRVYDGVGLEWGNGLSSDGRYLVYTDWDTGDLAVVDLTTTQHRRLTDKGPFTKSPEMGETSAFSPDDKQIAYGWYNQNRIPELRIIGFDGTNPRVLYRNEQSAWIRPHEWTPDGKQVLILIMRKGAPSQIALVSAIDGTVRIIKEVQAQDPGMDLSPDGRYIACSMPAEPGSSKRDIFIVNTNSGEISPLVTHAADDYSLGWAPDGERLFFASDRTGLYGVWSVQVSEGRAQGSPEIIKPDFSKADPVKLTTNGVLYYILGHMLSDVYTAAIDPDTGKIQGTPAGVKARYSGANAAPDWSPDGTRLAYRTNPGGMATFSAPAMISVLDVRTGEECQISPKIDSIDPNDGPRWAPDGRSVLVIGTRGDEKGIYRVDVQNGAMIPLVIIPQYQYVLHAVWSPDAKSIFYPQGNPVRILRRDLDTGKDTELASMTGPAGIPIVALSRDGKWLAFTSRDQGQQLVRLNLVPSAGGKVREVFCSQENGLIRSIDWTPDGRFLWFEKLTISKDAKPQYKMEHWRVSPDGSNLQKLELNFRGGQFRIHPDGRQIAFWNGQGRQELWALENFIPRKK
jgi:Tol biopolymer transport system component